MFHTYKTEQNVSGSRHSGPFITWPDTFSTQYPAATVSSYASFPTRAPYPISSAVNCELTLIGSARCISSRLARRLTFLHIRQGYLHAEPSDTLELFSALARQGQAASLPLDSACSLSALSTDSGRSAARCRHRSGGQATGASHIRAASSSAS